MLIDNTGVSTHDINFKAKSTKWQKYRYCRISIKFGHLRSYWSNKDIQKQVLMIVDILLSSKSNGATGDSKTHSVTFGLPM